METAGENGTKHPDKGRRHSLIPNIIPKFYAQLWIRWERCDLVLRLWSDRPWLRLDPAGQVGDLIEQTSALGHQLANLAISMHHGGVITTTEGLADLRQ